MKNPLEIAISLLAPHRCINCRKAGPILCINCAELALIEPPSRCYRCHKATSQSRVCDACHKRSSLSHVWIASEYDEIAKKLIYKLKFERARAASEVVARSIDDYLPDLPKNMVISFVPTASSRVRQRGYDQAKLIAKELSKRRGWEFSELLLRRGSSRQVGSSREKRIKQLEKAFMAKNLVKIKGKHILLVDDVVTTGATLEAASKELKKAGARLIDAVVFAQPID
jgi:ComF family protein